MVLAQVVQVALPVQPALLLRAAAVVRVETQVASVSVLRLQARLVAMAVYTVEVKAVALPMEAHTAGVRLLTAMAFLSRREVPTRSMWLETVP